MSQSVKEYVTALGYLGWGVVGVEAADAFAAYWSITHSGKPIPILFWTILGIVVLIVAPFFAFRRVRLQREALRNELSNLKDLRPTVTTIPMTEGKYARLNVRNTGHHQASFKVKVLQWQGLPAKSMVVGIQPYSVKWKETQNTAEFKILADDSSSIDIAEHHGLTLNDENQLEEGLQRIVVSCPSNPEEKLHVGSKLILSIQVLSQPELKSEYKKAYALVVGDRKWESFEEIGYDVGSSTSKERMVTQDEPTKPS